MGKTKIKILDESAPIEEPKKVVKKFGKKEYSISNPILEEFADQDKDEAVKQPKEEVKKETLSIKKSKEGQKPGKIKPRSKKYKQAIEDLDRGQFYPINEAVELAIKSSYSKFTGSLEVHINTKQANIRGLVSLPFMTGKKLRILAFGKGAENSGADFTGDEEKINEISKGKVDFDILITTFEWMPKLAKVAKVLGPKGLMPNPKNGTIADDLKKAVESFQAGKTEYKTESKAAVIHLSLGKLNQPKEELSENTKILLAAIGKSKIKNVYLTPTMGPSFRVDINRI